MPIIQPKTAKKHDANTVLSEKEREYSFHQRIVDLATHMKKQRGGGYLKEQRRLVGKACARVRCFLHALTLH
jgi:hypothetical protein